MVVAERTDVMGTDVVAVSEAESVSSVLRLGVIFTGHM